MSKIITVTLGDDLAPPEGWLILGYSAPEGGRTDIGTPIGKTWEETAALLGNALGRREWPDFIRANVRGNALRLSVPDEVDTIVFSASYNPSPDQSAPAQANPAFVTIVEEKFGDA